jgi:predicted aminopeptidase
MKHYTRLAGWIALLLVAGSLGACSTLRYYMQAAGGQLELKRKARPIEDVLADPQTPSALQERLRRVRAIREFASSELALPRNGSYHRYADLQRPYVVWNVFAAPEFSVAPKTWCFPIAGCVGYRGYFGQQDAERFAEQTRAQGYDVYVGGVPAYSTLGWLEDPVLSTFIGYPDAELARLMFHELAHQVAYVKGDSTFNESFAVTVELEGVRRWIAVHGTPAHQRAFEQADERKREFVELVARTRDTLGALYASDLPPESMRARKLQALDAMRREYQALKAGWGGYAGYDGWFAQPVNNAQLASVAIYSQLVPGFQALLADNGGELPKFYDAVRAMTRLSAEQRRARLGGPAAPADERRAEGER